jgi:hypothetical protein
MECGGMTAINVFQSTGALMVKNLRPGLTECGKIKIGQKGQMVKSRQGNEFQPPQKLDHFVVTTLQRGQDGNLVRDEEMHARFGAKPRELPVRLLFNDPWLNFQTVYTAFKGGARFCTGDGERATRIINGQATERQCPCNLLDQNYEGTDKCKINGTLSVMIDGAPVVGGVWKLRTTSINTCQGIASSLALLSAVTGGQISGIPLMLTVRPKSATTPKGQQTTVYVVGIEYRGTMEQLRELSYREALADATHGQRIQRIEEQARMLLAAPVVSDDEDEDVRDEFYPEAAAEARGVPIAAQPANGVSHRAQPSSLRDRLLAQASEVVDDATGEVIDAQASDWPGDDVGDPLPASLMPSPEPERAEPPKTTGNGTKTIQLYGHDGKPQGVYGSYGEFLTGVELIAKDETLAADVIGANYETLTRIATSPRAPDDIRQRADRLREMVSEQV